MRVLTRWFRTPLPLKFWLFAGAAFVAVLWEVGAVWAAIEWWGVAYESCGPNCVSSPPPLSNGPLAVAYLMVLLAIAAFLVWRAVRAYPRHS